jgi:hypothetical protein
MHVWPETESLVERRPVHVVSVHGDRAQGRLHRRPELGDAVVAAVDDASNLSWMERSTAMVSRSAKPVSGDQSRDHLALTDEAGPPGRPYLASE